MMPRMGMRPPTTGQREKRLRRCSLEKLLHLEHGLRQSPDASREASAPKDGGKHVSFETPQDSGSTTAGSVTVAAKDEEPMWPTWLGLAIF
eukprot:2095048-Amphidinium_carterae.1